MSLRMDEDRPDEEQSAQVQDDTFYALLNVPRDASTDLIKEKYRQLAILLHPDKQHDEHRRATANDRFQRLKRAYEVLSDPHLRAVYDALGEEGIRYAGEISRKYKSAEEIIAGIERLARKSGVRDTPTTSDTVVIGVDARTLTVPTSHIVPGARTPTFLDRLHGIEVSNFSVRHALHASVAPSTKLSLAARTASRATQGSFIGTVRHQFSPRLAVESSIACLHPLFMSIRASYDVDPHTELRLFTRFNSGRSILFPAFSVVVSRVLYPKAIGTVTFNSGWPPLLISNFTNNPPNITTNSSPSSFEIEIKSNPWTVSTVLSGDGNNGSIAIQGAYTYKVTSSTDVSISAVLTIPSGIAFVLTGVQRFGSQSKGAPPTILNVNVLLSMAGIELRIRCVSPSAMRFFAGLRLRSIHRLSSSRR
ncbi:uncharacterized protein EI90DRAFT_1411111 [Cantharellus anzutake]|uniref:uncharacterized protein n=1 Tax=Cantharellus anzutake TaxID=1750568 RepID=UPI0019065AE9|nr:uncharacterized protein EI90DRAFT_1411111 [Cantharellus anzutake]KAF8329564.1 hypothetical protein EI90DRAFT_1411111 [Cantharellus anzutake]